MDDGTAECEVMVSLQEILRKLQLSASVLACTPTEASAFTERGTITLESDAISEGFVSCRDMDS